jgi:hypothetical protein
VKVIALPSGAELKIDVAPFAVAKALYQSILEEMKAVQIDPEQEVDVNLFKDLFCVSFSSKKIELALKECMKRAIYNGARITDETWEPVEARDDYLKVCFEVAKENIAPFVKSLYAEYSHLQEMLRSVPASRPQTIQS